MALYGLRLADKCGDSLSHWQHASSETDDGGAPILAFASAARAEACREGLVAGWNLDGLVVDVLPESLIDDMPADEPEPEDFDDSFRYSLGDAELN